MCLKSYENTSYTKIGLFKEKLKNSLTEQRYNHTMRTVEKAMELCIGTSADKEVVFWAALLHDCAKYITPTQEQKELLKDFEGYDKVLHAPLGAIIAREEYGIEDERILNAIKYHTTGRADMTIEEKIVYLADAIEDGRAYPTADKIRAAARLSIDNGILASLRGVVEFEGSEYKAIHHLTNEAIKFLEENNG